jgi:uncharacterized phage infection (PIP) family protein YhgE
MGRRLKEKYQEGIQEHRRLNGGVEKIKLKEFEAGEDCKKLLGKFQGAEKKQKQMAAERMRLITELSGMQESLKKQKEQLDQLRERLNKAKDDIEVIESKCKEIVENKQLTVGAFRDRLKDRIALNFNAPNEQSSVTDSPDEGESASAPSHPVNKEDFLKHDESVESLVKTEDSLLFDDIPDIPDLETDALTETSTDDAGVDVEDVAMSETAKVIDFPSRESSENPLSEPLEQGFGANANDSGNEKQGDEADEG